MSDRQSGPAVDMVQLARSIRAAVGIGRTVDVRHILEDAVADDLGVAEIKIDVSDGPRARPYLWPSADNIPPRGWRFGRWLLSGAVTIVAAAGGTGKSSLIAGMMLSLASGRAVLGKAVYGGARRVWLLQLEDDHEEIARQLTAAAIALDLSEADCGDRLFVSSAMGGLGLPAEALQTARGEGGDFKLNEAEFERVEKSIAADEIDVLIVDPFVSSHQARENDTTAMDTIVKRWSLLAKRTGCAVVLVHHTRKANGEKSDVDSVRGSSAEVNAARIVLVLNRMTDKEAKALGIDDDDERRRLFSVDMGKSNRSSPEAAEWFRLESVGIGNGGKGAQDEVGAVVQWHPPEQSVELTELQIVEIEAVVACGTLRADVQSPDWIGHRIGPVIGQDSQTPSGRVIIKAMVKRWTDQGMLEVVERRNEGTRKAVKFVQLVERPSWERAL